MNEVPSNRFVAHVRENLELVTGSASRLKTLFHEAKCYEEEGIGKTQYKVIESELFLLEVNIILGVTEGLLDMLPKPEYNDSGGKIAADFNPHNVYGKVLDLTRTVQNLQAKANVLNEGFETVISNREKTEKRNSVSALSASHQSSAIGRSKYVKKKLAASSAQLALINKIFSDDEDPKLQYFIADVKWCDLYNDICCYCLPYEDNEDDLMAHKDELIHSRDYSEDLIFDFDYVRKQVSEYCGSKSKNGAVAKGLKRKR